MNNRIRTMPWLLLICASLSCGEVAESPYCAEVKDWAPWADVDIQPEQGSPINHITPISSAVVVPRVTAQGKDQGYFSGAVFSGVACTRSAFDSFPFASGISCISAHGEGARTPIDSDPTSTEPDTEVAVYVSPYSDPIRREQVPGVPLQAKMDAEQWINSGVLNDGLKVISLRCIAPDTHKVVLRRIVVARKKWFRTRWRPAHNTQRTLVIAHVCGSQPILTSLGGRVGFGFAMDNTPVSGAETSFAAILDSMNGTGAELTGDTPGTKRMAGDAATNGILAIMQGNPRTTLCPSVVHPAVVNPSGDPNVADPVYPLGSNAPSGEETEVTGHVTFDTLMDRSVPADSVLSYNVTSGSIEIKPGSIRWVSNHRIEFTYTNSGYGHSSGGSGSFRIEMRVHAHLARAANSNFPIGTGNKFLDGGDVGENRSGLHGVANNGDDFVWEFSRQ